MKQLMKGNDAIAEAAVRAGCRFFAGYPITPQSEILEYLSWRMPQAGGTFLQSESELAGISMIYGAAATGMRAMTTSSGPGFSLMGEGISYIASAELPCVIVDVQRYGSGLADIFTGQGDYWQATRNGGHGDYRCLVFAPESVQESVELVRLAFEKSEEYRNPVLILSDASISQMMESVELPTEIIHDPDSLPWAMKGKGKGEAKCHTSVMYFKPNYDAEMKEKYDRMAAQEQRWEAISTEDAELILVAYGISARICQEAVELAQSAGLKVGLIRPISLFPFPQKAFEALDFNRVKAFAAVELSCLSQMIEDVSLCVRGRAAVHPIRGGMRVYDSADILREAEIILAGQAKEAY